MASGVRRPPQYQKINDGERKTEIQVAFWRGLGIGAKRENSPKVLGFLGKFHDNQILQTLRNFIVRSLMSSRRLFFRNKPPRVWTEMKPFMGPPASSGVVARRGLSHDLGHECISKSCSGNTRDAIYLDPKLPRKRNDHIT